MKTIVNKTLKPMRLPLPGGKTLHLGPAGSGQVQDDALERPHFKKLIEAGELEVLGDGGTSAGGDRSSARVRGQTQGHVPGRHRKPTGDR